MILACFDIYFCSRMLFPFGANYLYKGFSGYAGYTNRFSPTVLPTVPCRGTFHIYICSYNCLYCFKLVILDQSSHILCTKIQHLPILGDYICFLLSFECNFFTESCTTISPLEDRSIFPLTWKHP